MLLDDDRRRLLLTLARASVGSALGRGAPPDVEGAVAAGLDGAWGVFVTLRNKGQLRGCRGRLESEAPIARTVSEVARQSALDDPRFPPVRPDELDALELEVSILHGRRVLRSPQEIVLGRDGLLLTQGWHQGFLLPQVATENGYDVPTFLDRLCLKAGLPEGAWSSPDAHLEAFEVEHFSG